VSSFFVTGGTLRHDAPCYVERRADRELSDALRRGEFCYVLTSRQMGKSSLMVRTASRLREEGVAVAVLDLTAVGQNLDAEQWYDGLLCLLARALDLERELEEFWLQQDAPAARLGPLQRWMEALRQVVLPRVGGRMESVGSMGSMGSMGRVGSVGSVGSVGRPSGISHTPLQGGRLVIFIDEIDAVRSLPFSVDEFFAAIRECYNRRSEDPEFERLTFCLLGVATPSDLIRDPRTTPFNIGRRIELNDFTEAEADILAWGLSHHKDTETQGGNGETRNSPLITPHRSVQSPSPDARHLLRRILHWTGGHPYLTQRLCQAVARGTMERQTDGEIEGGRDVDRLCQELFLAADARETDDNLVFVRERLLRGGEDLASLLHLYEQVRRRRRVANDETNPLVSALRLSGVVRVVRDARGRLWGHRAAGSGVLAVRNRIYERVFDRGWIAISMPDAEVRRQHAAYRRGVLRATGAAAVVLAVVAGVALVAIDQARSARRLLYAADMNVAQRALEDGNLARARELLEAHRPRRFWQEDLRGFEWRYFWRQCQDQSLVTLRKHQNWVTSVAFSPQGRHVATASNDGTVLLWKLAGGGKGVTLAGRDPIRLQGDLRRVQSLAFSPDGRWLAAGCGNWNEDEAGWLVIWPLDGDAAGRPLTVDAHPKAVHDIAVSRDGRRLATACVDGTIGLWDTGAWSRTGVGALWAPAGGEPARTPPARIALLRHNPRGRPVMSLAFSPDNQVLASGDIDSSIQLWRAADGHRVGALLGHTNAVNGLAFSPDGRLLASTGKDRALKLWDVAGRRETVSYKAHASRVGTVAFSPDGQLVATGSDDSTIRLWRMIDPRGALEEVATLKGHAAAVLSIAFSPRDGLLASGSADETARLWNPAAGATDRLLGGTKLGTRGGYRYTAQDLIFSADSRLLATADGGNGLTGWRAGDVLVWDVARGQEAVALRGGHLRSAQHPEDGAASCAAFSPDGRFLASGSRDATVRLWRLRDGQNVNVLAGHEGRVRSVAFSPDGRWLASGGLDHTIRLWELVGAGDQLSARPVAVLRGHTGPVRSIAFSPDGTRLASTGTDLTVRLWNITGSPRAMAVFRGHRQPGTAVAFSPDGQTVVSGSEDAEIRLWRVAAGPDQEPRILRGHLGRVFSMAIAPDGRTLASASADYTVKLWNLATLREVATLKSHEDFVFSVAFSPDGNTLASGSSDRTVRLWRAAPFAETDARTAESPHPATGPTASRRP
jgi:WD40 repeat protein